MKRRFITAALVLPVLLLFSALLACNLHGLLAGQPHLVWHPKAVLPLLLHVRAVQRFFLVFAGLSLLLVLAAMASSTGVQYRNALQKIAPGIVIPEAAGRGEYGTARFMTRRELRRRFSCGQLHTKALLKEVKQHETTQTGRTPPGLER